MSQERETDMQRVQQACETLSEYFDSVQIFATRHEPEQEGGTVNVAWGSGNWFSRYGIVQEWMIRQDERTRKHTRENDL